MIVIILGMHRSGTSMLSSIVHTLGINMGPENDLKRNNPDSQPHGYWEDQSFVAINRDVIHAAGGHWYKPPGRLRLLSASVEYRDRIEKLIKKRDQSDNWGWKDPRNSLTIECYQFALQPKEDVRYLHIFRNGHDVARSLIRRGEKIGNTQEQAKAFEGLAFEHERRIRDFINRYQPMCYTLSYEDVLRYPKYEVNKLAQYLGVNNEGLIKVAGERIKLNNG